MLESRGRAFVLIQILYIHRLQLQQRNEILGRFRFNAPIEAKKSSLVLKSCLLAAAEDGNKRLKPVSVKTNSGLMHLNAAGHEGNAVFAHVARSAQMHLVAVRFN